MRRLIPAFLVFIVTSSLLVFHFFNNDKVRSYYFPKIEVYMTIYSPFLKDYGFVYFSRDRISSSSFPKNIDYIKIHKDGISSIIIAFNIYEKTKFYIEDRWNNTTLHPSLFNMQIIDRKDTLFFESKTVPVNGTVIDSKTLRPHFFGIYIENYLQSVSYTGYDICGNSIIIEAKPYYQKKIWP